MDWEKKLLGEVIRIKARGNYDVDPSKIAENFKEKDSIMYLHCRGCGTIFEFNEAQVRDLANQFSVDFKKINKRSNYFESDGCEVCDGDAEKIYLRAVKKN